MIRAGWAEVAFRDLRDPPRYPTRKLQPMRGLPNQPIIFPKLKWNPETHEFQLMPKRDHTNNIVAGTTTRRSTRWSTTRRPPGFHNIYEDTDDGPRPIKYPYNLKLDTIPNREKDVWISQKNEEGTRKEEIAEFNEAAHMTLDNNNNNHH